MLTKQSWLLTSRMSLIRSWADCFLLREPIDNVRSMVLLRGEAGWELGAGTSCNCEDDDA
jgi:hypothetical protein